MIMVQGVFSPTPGLALHQCRNIHGFEPTESSLQRGEVRLDSWTSFKDKSVLSQQCVHTCVPRRATRKLPTTASWYDGFALLRLRVRLKSHFPYEDISRHSTIALRDMNAGRGTRVPGCRAARQGGAIGCTMEGENGIPRHNSSSLQMEQEVPLGASCPA